MHVHPSSIARQVLALSLALVLSAGAATIGYAQTESPSHSERCPGDYLIGPEDVLDIAIWNSPELSRRSVRPDGKISLPLVNDVQAAGLTPMQLRVRLSQVLATYVAAPIVSVIVREIHSLKVSVIGEVKTPGRYELKSRATVIEVLAMAGGPTDYAMRGKIVVLREEAGSTKQIPFTFERVGAKSGHPSNISAEPGLASVCLMPGDIVLVP
jgi:polysaccharide export outer membrane protein